MSRIALESARQFLEKGEAHMAAFVMRDTEIARELGLTDLFWAACNDGSCHRNDVEPFLDEIDAALKAREEQQT